MAKRCIRAPGLRYRTARPARAGLKGRGDTPGGRDGDHKSVTPSRPYPAGSHGSRCNAIRGQGPRHCWISRWLFGHRDQRCQPALRSAGSFLATGSALRGLARVDGLARECRVEPNFARRVSPPGIGRRRHRDPRQPKKIRPSQDGRIRYSSLTGREARLVAQASRRHRYGVRVAFRLTPEYAE